MRWDADGEIRELPPLKGDTVGFAFGINDVGQVVGSSGLCSNTSIPPAPNGPHAVLWDKDGSPTDLGNLGGTDNIANAVNNRGDVVGSAVSGTDGTVHGFLWTKGKGMQDIGAFPGAFATFAPCCKTINDRGEIPANSGWYLQFTASINNAGEIAGQGTINGEVHAFLLTPTHHGAGSDSLAPVALSTATPKLSPEELRKMLGSIGGRPTPRQ